MEESPQTIGIIGRGFGLYGYLPAVCELWPHSEVLLPKNSQDIIKQRPELQSFLNGLKIIFVDEISKILRNAEILIIASTPKKQAALIQTLIKDESVIKNLYLEKPIAPDARQANSLVHKLVKQNIPFCVGYVMRYTSWFHKLKRFLSEASASDQLLIKWYFKAHHYRKNLKNWKRFSEEGGGAINFYGIHLIAVIAELGQYSIFDSTFEKDALGGVSCWRAQFGHTEKPQIIIDLKSNHDDAYSKFTIHSSRETKKNLVNLSGPFQEGKDDQRLAQQDRRCKYLLDYLSDNTSGKFFWQGLTLDCLKLWKDIENKTVVK